MSDKRYWKIEQCPICMGSGNEPDTSDSRSPKTGNAEPCQRCKGSGELEVSYREIHTVERLSERPALKGSQRR